MNLLHRKPLVLQMAAAAMMVCLGLVNAWAGHAAFPEGAAYGNTAESLSKGSRPGPLMRNSIRRLAVLSDTVEQEEGSDAPVGETLPEGKVFPSAERFNLADFRPADADPGDPLASYGGRIFRSLYEQDNSWNSSVFGAASRSPEKVAAQLGRGRNSVMGRYNITEKSHDPANPDSWAIQKWNRVSVDIRDGNGTKLPETSNVKQILAMASVYSWYHDPWDVDAFRSYASSLWKASHSSKISMSEVYYDEDCLDRKKVEKALKNEERRMPATPAQLSEGESLPETAADGSAVDQPPSDAAQLPDGASEAPSQAETAQAAPTESAAAPAESAAVPSESAAAGGETDSLPEESAASEEDELSSYMECPGHVDLSVHVTVWTMDGERNLFTLDRQASRKDAMNYHWQGWTEKTMAEARRLAESDWYADYGLSVSLFSKLAPLTESEIEAELELLPEDISPKRLALARTALGSIGRIPYYWGGKPVSGDYDKNHFFTVTIPDYKGRVYRGLDCSGWLTWVYWNATGTPLSEIGTAGQVHLGRGIRRANLQTGDIIIRPGSDETVGHVQMFLRWSETGEAICIHETGGVTNNVCQTISTDYGASCRNLVD